MAHEIFNLKHFETLNVDAASKVQVVPITSHKNGSATRPLISSLMIWEPRGEFETTGHVAVVVGTSDRHVDIVEQNVEDCVWPDGQDYSRRLAVSANESDGGYHVHAQFSGSMVRGWVNISESMAVGESGSDMKKTT